MILQKRIPEFVNITRFCSKLKTIDTQIAIGGCISAFAIPVVKREESWDGRKIGMGVKTQDGSKTFE